VLGARIAAPHPATPAPDQSGAPSAPGIGAPVLGPARPNATSGWMPQYPRRRLPMASSAQFPNPNCDVPFVVADPVTELQELRRRCDANQPDACTHLGFACEPADWGRYPRGTLPSARLTDEACAALRSPPALTACSTGGGMSWFDRGCNGGDLLGCWQPVPAWQARPKRYTDVELREKASLACEQGMAAACFDLQRPPLFTSKTLSIAYGRIGAELLGCVEDGGTTCMPSAYALDALTSAKSRAASEVAEAAEANIVDLQRKCDAKVASACSDLAQHYLEGPTKDSVRGAALAQRACDLGGSAGCFTVAALYGTGEGL
jgi:TPR repeat protein